MRYRKIDAIQLYERGNYKPILLVFARGDDGKRYSIRQEGLTSYFWSATEPDYNLDLQKKVKKVESGYTSIYGKPLWKITSKMPGDVIDLRDGLPHHEADIHWPECKLIELGITDGFELNDDTDSGILRNCDMYLCRIRIKITSQMRRNEVLFIQ